MICNILKPFLIISNIDSLLKNIQFKLIKNHEFKQNIPKPDLVLKHLKKYCLLNSIIGYKNIIVILKYFVVYTMEFDDAYEINSNSSKTKNVRPYSFFIYQIFTGDKSIIDNKNIEGWDFNDDSKYIIESNAYILMIIYFIDSLINKKFKMMIPIS